MPHATARLSFVISIISVSITSAPVSAQKGENYAFLVACSGYNQTQLKPLPYTINDIEQFQKALIATGFDNDHIKVLHDKKERRYHSEKAKILAELDLLIDGLKAEDTLVVGLSGHGVHYRGEKVGYFCPLDANINKPETLLAMEGDKGLFEKLKSCKAKKKLLIVNACRNDPFSDLAMAVNKGNFDDEDKDEIPEGIAAIYACKEGQKSYFDPERKRGIFFDHVIQQWQAGGNLEEFFDTVTRKTKTDADKTFGVSQVPVVKREYKGEWIIGKVEKPTDPELIAFKVGTETFKMELVKIKAGSFKMGSSARELALTQEKFGYDLTNEKEHEVELSAFYMGKYPVTKRQFELFAKDKGYKTEAEEGDGAYGWDAAKKGFKKSTDYHWKNPGFPQSDDHPVVCVSWNDAKAFCEWLGKKSGKKVRLPSEAQWEYACRAGSKKLYFFGDDPEDLKEYANVRDASFRTETGQTGGIKGDDGYAFTSPVGKLKKNDFGLFDMHGNVWQWCEDGYRKDYENVKTENGKDPIEQQFDNCRVLRGGSWYSSPLDCRTAIRYGRTPDRRSNYGGFRLVVLP